MNCYDDRGNSSPRTGSPYAAIAYMAATLLYLLGALIYWRIKELIFGREAIE